MPFDDPEAELGRAAVEAEVAADAGVDEGAVQGVLSRGSVYTLVTVVQAATVMLAIPVLTRLLDAADYGLLTTALVAQAVLTHLAGCGMPAAVTRTFFHEGGPDGARALIIVAAAAAAAVAVVALATGPLWSQVFGTLEFGALLALAVISAAFSATLVSAQMVLQAEAWARRYVTSAVIAIAGGQLSGIAAVALGAGPTGYMSGLAFGFAAALAYAWPVAGFRPGPLREAATRRPLVATAMRVGLPTIWMSLSLYLLSAADRVVVERIEGLEAAGAYYIAYAVGSLAIFLVAAVNGAWSPAIFGAEEAGRWRFLAASAVEITRIAAWTAAALIVAAPVVLRLFAPPDYDVSGLGVVSLIVAASALPYLWYLSSWNLAIWYGRTGRLAVASVAAVVVNIALCVVLIGPLGLEGVAAATLLAYVFLGLLTWLWTRPLAAIPWEVSGLAAAAAPAAVATAIALALPEDGLWLAVRVVLAAASGLVVLRTVTGGPPAAS